LDLSLCSTGMSDGTRTDVVQTSPKELMEERMDRITRGIVSFALADGGADLAVIEWSSYGSPGSSGEELAALRYMAIVRLWRLHIPVAKVSPATLKLYVTGDGRATKPQMVAAVAARYMHDFSVCKVKDGRYDMADAFGLAAMGYDQSGHPLPDRATELDRSALASVKWPTLLSDD
jgi:Holliday junction resolvasome RuvABC endonuclease subunit